jgi:hypothetical protein
MERNNQEHPDWDWPFTEKIDANQQFVKLAEQLDLNNLVHFFIRDIKQKYLESSIMVPSSRVLKVLDGINIEAMACGVPFVLIARPGQEI